MRRTRNCETREVFVAATSRCLFTEVSCVYLVDCAANFDDDLYLQVRVPTSLFGSDQAWLHHVNVGGGEGEGELPHLHKSVTFPVLNKVGIHLYTLVERINQRKMPYSKTQRDSNLHHLDYWMKDVSTEPCSWGEPKVLSVIVVDL